MEFGTSTDAETTTVTPPVVIFAYRRLDTLCQTLDGVRRNGAPLVIVFCDGAKGNGDEADVRAVRDHLVQIDWIEVKLVLRPQNLGLGRSVLSAVEEVFKFYEAAIFLEDDIVLGEGAYAWLCAALKTYRHEMTVMSVAAWTHPAIIPDDLNGAPYFDGKGECWGWAAWRRSWRGMDRTALQILEMAQSEGVDINRFGPDIPIMAEETHARNLWAARWWSLHLLNRGLCLRPANSMARHVGWDPHATTTTDDMAFWTDPPLEPPPAIGEWPSPAEHPACAEIWQRAILASGAGPFPKDGRYRPRRAADFEAIHRLRIRDNQAGWTTEDDGNEVFALILELIETAGVTDGARVLEFGCGDGTLTWRLAKAGLQVVGADVAPSALELAKRRLQASGLDVDLRQINGFSGPDNLPVATVDVVIDSLLLHNLVGIDRQLFFQRALSALRPGGCLLVVTMCGRPKTQALAERFDHRTRVVFDGLIAELTFAEPAAIAEEINRAGFALEYERVVPASPNGEDLYVAVARAKAQASQSVACRPRYSSMTSTVA
jgi:SAM-dependent methyltransferase